MASSMRRPSLVLTVPALALERSVERNSDCLATAAVTSTYATLVLDGVRAKDVVATNVLWMETGMD